MDCIAFTSVFSHLEGVRHSQSHDTWAQGAFPHHRENGSSQDHTVTNKLQIDCQPPAELQGFSQLSMSTITAKYLSIKLHKHLLRRKIDKIKTPQKQCISHRVATKRGK